ncbi:hypothetical protein OIU34_24170 [Pararhizobium sp. BT-229]|uniref:hypothetical protein n=1 Tax=Pararhizobium sp. BT-229 TaxID=2986923 RepID=UPI0021F6A0EF|nr:hypothetical protein [Pararhizobium sp. BT-229]MCV9964996.1 hypothetical protein [Pararhizobium sp. BT-229]
MTPHQTLADAIQEIKLGASQKVMDTIEDAPQDALGHLRDATRAMFAELTTSDKLRLLAGAGDIGDLGVDLRGFDSYGDIAEMADVMFAACVEYQLTSTRNGIAAAAFAVGFLPAALELLETAEAAAGTKWVPLEKVEAVRSAYDKLASAEGTKEDLETLVGGVYLFARLMESPKDKVLHRRHNTDMETMRKVTSAVKFYRDMLGPGWPLAPEALDLLASRQRNMPIIEAENARKRASRAALGR